MTIEACVAHAIHQDLDIVGACPKVVDCQLKDLEGIVERYVVDLQAKLVAAIGEVTNLLEAKDAPGLTLHLMNHVSIPLPMLSAMCETIVAVYPLDVTYQGEMRTGESVYEVRMTVDVTDIFQPVQA